MNPLIEEKEITVTTQAGASKKYVISKVPAMTGRKLVSEYPLGVIPKLGEYKVSEDCMLTLMSFVEAYLPDGSRIRLTSSALVDNHFPDWETLVKVEMAMMELNCSFFGNAKSLGFLKDIKSEALSSLTKMLTDSLAQLSQKTQRSTKTSKKT